MGPEDIDTKTLVKRTLYTLSSRKGTASFILKYLVWDPIFILVIGGIIACVLAVGYFEGIKSYPNVFEGTSIDGPEAGPLSLLLLFFTVLIVLCILIAILFLIATPVLYGGLVRVGDGFIDGRPVRFMDFWRMGRRNYWRTMGILFLMALISSVAVNIVQYPMSLLSHWFPLWSVVIMQPVRCFTGALTILAVMAPLIIEHRERKNLGDSIGGAFKVFLGSWKIILKLLVLITIIVSPPIMFLQVIGILTISSPYLMLPLSIPISFAEMIFIPIFMNHLIRSRTELVGSDKDAEYEEGILEPKLRPEYIEKQRVMSASF